MGETNLTVVDHGDITPALNPHQDRVISN